MNRRPHIPTHHHTVPQAHHFFQAQHQHQQQCFFVATSSNWLFGIYNWWSSPIGKADYGYLDYPNNFPEVSQRNSLGLHWDYGFFKVCSGVEWQQESPQEVSPKNIQKPANYRNSTQGTPPVQWIYLPRKSLHVHVTWMCMECPWPCAPFNEHRIHRPCLDSDLEN